MEAVRTYTSRIDSKKRVTIRGASYSFYDVKEFENGCILLEPRELKAPESLSAKTLKDIDESVENFKKGRVSGPIDLSDF